MIAADGLGFQSSIKVYPVQMVSGVPRLRRENGHPGDRQQKTPRPAATGTAPRKRAEAVHAPDCYTVTYDRHSQLREYSCRPSREYTF